MILHEENLGDYDFIELLPIADAHIGSPYFNEQKLMEDIKWLGEEDNRFALINGDIMDCATIHSVSNSYESNYTPHGELKYARKLFKPVKDKILTAVMGNHERRIYRNDSVDLMEELAFSLDTFYVQEGLVLKLRFGKRSSNGKRQVYTIYHTHGFTGSRTIGGKMNRLEKLRKIVVADVYIVSHSHQRGNFPKEIFMPDLRNNKITKKYQQFINTGAYLDYGGYGQTKAYDPTPLGSPYLRFYGKEKKIEVIA